MGGVLKSKRIFFFFWPFGRDEIDLASFRSLVPLSFPVTHISLSPLPLLPHFPLTIPSTPPPLSIPVTSPSPLSPTTAPATNSSLMSYRWAGPSRMPAPPSTENLHSRGPHHPHALSVEVSPPEEYFRGVSPLCRKMLDDMTAVREKWGDTWNELSYQQQCRVIDQAMVDEVGASLKIVHWFFLFVFKLLPIVIVSSLPPSPILVVCLDGEAGSEVSTCVCLSLQFYAPFPVLLYLPLSEPECVFSALP